MIETAALAAGGCLGLLVPGIVHFCYKEEEGRLRLARSLRGAMRPVLAAGNGAAFFLAAAVRESGADALLCALAAMILLCISVTDWVTFEIPPLYNLALGLLGILRLAVCGGVRDGIIGAFAVSLPLFFLYLVSRGAAIGGGDVKLMAAGGLFLGWQGAILAFFLGCLSASVIHLLRMRFSEADHVLALGPYLSAGIFIAALWGEPLIRWYLELIL